MPQRPSLVRARAPLRLGLAGGGSDVAPYCDVYGGAVLNGTIDRYADASLAPRDDGQLVFKATDLAQTDTTDAAIDLDLGQGLRLHRAVYSRMMRDFNGGVAEPVTLTTLVDSPPGSGLGSSSALVVAMVEVFKAYLGAPLGPYEVAQLAFDIERRELGLLGGKQDQFAAAFGGVNFIEFRGNDLTIVKPIRLSRSLLCELESSLVLFFSGASRDSSKIIETQTKALDRGGDPLQAMHDLKAEAFSMRNSLTSGGLGEIADIIARGWAAKKATSAAVTNPEIDAIYDLALSAGALAGKVSGAGGGGFMMLVADPTRRAELIRTLEAAQPNGRCSTAHFTFEGVENWVAP